MRKYDFEMIDIESKIKELINRKARALVHRNCAALNEIIHPSFVYLNAGGRLFDKAGYIDAYCSSGSVVFLDQTLIECRAAIGACRKADILPGVGIVTLTVDRPWSAMMAHDPQVS